MANKPQLAWAALDQRGKVDVWTIRRTKTAAVRAIRIWNLKALPVVRVKVEIV